MCFTQGPGAIPDPAGVCKSRAVSSRGPGSSLGWAQSRRLPALCPWSGACRPRQGPRTALPPRHWTRPRRWWSHLALSPCSHDVFPPRQPAVQHHLRVLHGGCMPDHGRVQHVSQLLPGCSPASGDSSGLWGHGPGSCTPIRSDPTRTVCTRSPASTACVVMPPCPTGPRAWQKLSGAKRGKGSWPCGSNGDMGHKELARG